MADKLCVIQFSSNPVLHKFCLVPCRHLSVGSYIFSTRHSGQSRTTTNTLCAFSVILPLNQSNWYLERQSTFAEMFSDAITRFKAASLVESVEDLVCRCTREFLAVFLLFGALERWPLVMGRDLTQLRIQHSHLWELNKMPNSDFLARCITACLVCRGRCTILGGTPTEMAQLMHTLVAFLQPTDRIFCLRPYKMRFSPYLRLQAIKRSELHQFLDKASTAHWSAALLDIDRRSVSFTGLYHGKHRAQKMRSQQHQIGQIFRDAVQAGIEVPAQILREMDQLDADGGGRSVADILETQTVQAEPSVKDFLDLVHLMPLNRPARISFVDHFHLRLDNRAKALIDTSFGIVLARAENLQPEFAEFIAQQTTNAGRHIRQ
uniref:Folliculin n=1 Tax=Globodera pallida TaxID=36090 RepID=A0A183C9V4_GLOPA